MEKRELIKKLENILPIMRKAKESMDLMEQIDERYTQLQDQYLAPRQLDFVSFALEIFLGVMIGVQVLGRLLFLIFPKALWVVLVSAIIGAVVDWMIWGKIHQMRKEKLKAEMDQWEADYREEEAKLAETLSPYRNQILEVVPEKYAVPAVVECLYDYLINGRADSMKEAINLFEEEQHRRQMEQNQEDFMNACARELTVMQEAQAQLEQRVRNAEARANIAEESLIQMQYDGYHRY